MSECLPVCVCVCVCVRERESERESECLGCKKVFLKKSNLCKTELVVLLLCKMNLREFLIKILLLIHD